MAASRREFLSPGWVWSRDVAVRSPQCGPAQLLQDPPGKGSGRALLPLCFWTPPRMISFFGLKNACSCFTACFTPVTNTPDNASLWFYQNHLLGLILYITLCCQPHLQPTKLTAPAGSIAFPTERAQVSREGASQQPKLGVRQTRWRCVPLFSWRAGSAL